MHGALVDILLNKACQIVPALNARHGFLREAEIHQGAIGGETVIHFGQRVDDGRGAVDIVGAKIRVDRAHIIGDGLPCLAAVHRGIGVQAHGNVGVDGVDTGAEDAAARRLAACNVLAVGLEHELEQLVGVIVIIAVVVHFGAVDEGIQLLVAFPVVLDGFQQLGTRAAFLVKDQLLDGGQGVRTGGHAAGLGADAVVLGTALGQVVARLHAVLKQS